MIVVADAGPIHYLVLVQAVPILGPLYGRVLIPQSVASELLDPNAPVTVQSWIAQPPSWFEILPDPPSDPTLGFLDAGEQAAIALALKLNADRVLIDEQAGRTEAKRRHLSIRGTLGVLAEAHRANLLDFEKVLLQLQQTNFYLSSDLIDRVRRELLA